MSAFFSGFVSVCAWASGLLATLAIGALITEFRKAGWVSDSCGKAMSVTEVILMGGLAVILLTFFLSEFTKP